MIVMLLLSANPLPAGSQMVRLGQRQRQGRQRALAPPQVSLLALQQQTMMICTIEECKHKTREAFTYTRMHAACS